MGLDNIEVFPRTKDGAQIDSDGQVLEHTREGNATIREVHGKSTSEQGEPFKHVGTLNPETGKYDLEITTSKDFTSEFLENRKQSTSVISLDKPLKATPSGLCDKLYKYGEEYKILTLVGEKPFEPEYNKEEVTFVGEQYTHEGDGRNLIEIKEIWGNTWQDDTDSVNLIHNFIGNYNLSTGDGTLMTDSACKCTDFIEIVPTESYYVHGTRGVNVCAYDKNKTFISGMLTVTYLNHPSAANNNFSLPSNAKYIRASIRDVVTPYQIVKGTSALPYEPYHKADLSNIQHLGELYVDESGQPILDGEGREQYKIEIESVNGNLFNYPLSVGDRIANNGVSIQKNEKAVSCLEYIEVDIGEKYYICTNAEKEYYRLIMNYDENKKFIDFAAIGENKQTLFTAKSKYIRIVAENLKNDVTPINDIRFALFKSDTPETYIPHKSHKTSILLPCQLCKVGDAADRLYWDSEKGKYIIEKNIAGPEVFKNLSLITNTYEVNDNKYYFAEFTSPVPFTSNTINILTTKLKVNNALWGNIDSEGIRAMNKVITMRVLFDKVTDITIFVNDMDIYIETTNPQLIETNVLEQAVLSCYKDKTHLFVAGGTIAPNKVICDLLVPTISDFPQIDLEKDTVTDGITVLYPLPGDEITESDISFNASITTYGTDTQFNFNGAVAPGLILDQVPIDYAYNAHRKMYKAEKLELEQSDVDTDNESRWVSIQGQSYENLLLDPIKEGIVTLPIDIQVRDGVSESPSNALVPLKEVRGDTFINLLESKMPYAKLKPKTAFSGTLIDGRTIVDGVPTEYCLNEGDRLAIDEIRGNTKVQRARLPYADVAIREGRCGGNAAIAPLVAQDANYFISDEYIWAEPLGQGIAINLLAYNEDGTIIPLASSDFAVLGYDKDFNFIKTDSTMQGGLGHFVLSWLGNPGYIKVRFKRSIFTGNPKYGIYVVKDNTTAHIPYSEPKLAGYKTFPIQSVGELLIDEENQPILDTDGNLQYKIDIVSGNRNWFSPDRIIKKPPIISDIGGHTIYFPETTGNWGSTEGNTRMKIKCPYQPNTAYIVSYKIYIDEHTVSDAAPTTMAAYTDGTVGNINGGSNPNKTIDYIYFSSPNYIGIYDIQIELGTTRSAYTDHHVACKSIILNQALQQLGDHADKLFWNGSRYVVDRRIQELAITTKLLTGVSITDDIIRVGVNISNTPFISGRFRSNSPYIVEQDTHVYFDIPKSVLEYMGYTPDYTGANNLLVDSNTKVIGVLKTPVTVETDIGEQIIMPGYSYGTHMYTEGTSTFEQAVNAKIAEVNADMHCTTMDLVVPAYIKPNTQYTLFIETTKTVDYNLGGLSGQYAAEEPCVVITTPQTLSHRNLALTGAGDLGKIILFEGSWTDRYVPESFVDDVFSVGDYDIATGQYKLSVSRLKQTQSEWKLNHNLSEGVGGISATAASAHACETYFELPVPLPEVIRLSYAGTDYNKVVFYNETKQYISGYYYHGSGFANITVPAGAYYIRIGANTGSATGDQILELLNKIKVETPEGVYIAGAGERPETLFTWDFEQPLMRYKEYYDTYQWDADRGRMCMHKKICHYKLTGDLVTLPDEQSGVVRNDCVRFAFPSTLAVGIMPQLGISDKLVYESNARALLDTLEVPKLFYHGLVSGVWQIIITLSLKNDLHGDPTAKALKSWLNANTPTLIGVYEEAKIIDSAETQNTLLEAVQGENTYHASGAFKPYIHFRDPGLVAAIQPITAGSYYLFGQVDSPITFGIGQDAVVFNPGESCKLIEVSKSPETLELTTSGQGTIRNIMLRKDDRLDIPYIEGAVHSGDLTNGKYVIGIVYKDAAGKVQGNYSVSLDQPLSAEDKLICDGTNWLLQRGTNEPTIVEKFCEPVVDIIKIAKIEFISKIPVVGQVEGAYKNVRTLKPAENVKLNYLGLGHHKLTWEPDVGVETFVITLNGAEIATTSYKTPEMQLDHEIMGDIAVASSNTLTTTPGTPTNVKTLPNAFSISGFVATTTTTHQLVVMFDTPSKIAETYMIEYKVDDGEVQQVVKAVEPGDSMTHELIIPTIAKYVDIRVISINDIGRADYVTFKRFYKSQKPIWTYSVANNKIQYRWTDDYPGTAQYTLHVREIANGKPVTDWVEHPGGSNEGIQGITIDKFIEAHKDKTYETYVNIFDGTFTHIPSDRVVASKDLDKSLVAPKDFKMTWLEEGVAKFTWLEDYDNEIEFQFSYILNGQPEKTITIPANNVEGSSQMEYVYRFEDYGVFSGKVRMRWALGTSPYTDFVTATFVAVTGLPPGWIIKNAKDRNKILIQWEAQAYVDKYEVQFDVYDAVGDQLLHTKTLNLTEDMFELDTTDIQGKYVSIKIKTHFTTGVVSEFGDTIKFKPTLGTQILEQMNYNNTPTTVKLTQKTVTVDQKTTYTAYQRIYTTVDWTFPMHVKMINADTLEVYPYAMTYWGKNQKLSAKIIQAICVTGAVSKYQVYTISTAINEFTARVLSIAYAKTQADYPLNTVIQKATIVCIGDSLTSGHPGYWAESGTGDPQHSYPYWLDRRLKYQYTVINKGYGSDRTFNVLARFQKDVIDLNPQYCIIQVGTNDIYWGQAEAGDNEQAFWRTVEEMKENIRQCVNLCFANNITPILGTLIPRTQSITIPLVGEGIKVFNEWIKEYANNTEGLHYVDLYNAGKSKQPPTPLEDPNSPGALNPIYDGDNKYDAEGNIIFRGAGIHLNAAGYRIWAEEIPLDLFRATESGLKLYVDADCKTEEYYDTSDKANPFYRIRVQNMSYNRPVTIVRYIKNVGEVQSLFVMYQSNANNVQVQFGNTIDAVNQQFVNGTIYPQGSIPVYITFLPGDKDSQCSVDVHLVGREFKMN